MNVTTEHSMVVFVQIKMGYWIIIYINMLYSMILVILLLFKFAIPCTTTAVNIKK